jgi:outer membrane lipoprotein-sorting protein
MMKFQWALSILMTSGILAAEAPSGDWILRKVDENIGSDNKISMGEMIIRGRRGTRTVRSKSWIRGMEQSFTEYLAPAREKGTKMLKLGDQLWMYSPETDRTIMIAGHMLRQSVMGSDLSYEDLMEDPRLTRLYEADVVGVDTVLDRACWVLQLTAKVTDIAYHARRIWVDQERFVALRENRYAKGGTLLKTTDVESMRRVGDRWIADAVVFKDVLKSGYGTTFVLESIEFDAKIPGYIFSKAALRK